MYRRAGSKLSISVAFLISLALAFPIGVATGEEQGSPFDYVEWKKGPCTGDLGKIAEVRVPGDCIFAGETEMKTIMEAGQNIYSGAELGYLASPDGNLEMIFEFDDSGYVKDDEKTTLDHEAMLKSLKKTNKQGNEEREKRGWSKLYLVDWQTPPHYDEQTHNLEWATLLRTERDEQLINYNTRLLGRHGVMRVTLVTTPENLEESLPLFKKIISDFSYKQGYRYAEYRQGDKLAKYGLSALVVGGAAAVAAKTGLLKSLWKLIVAAGIGVAAFFRKVFGRKTTA